VFALCADQTFNEEDNAAFDSGYLWGGTNRFAKPQAPPIPDFGIISKRGSNAAEPQSATWWPSLQQVWVNRGDTNDSGCGIIARMSMSNVTAVQRYGAPSEFFLEVQLQPPSKTAQKGVTPIRLEFQFFNKTATRLGEAAFLSFAPQASASANGSSWSMDVMGIPVDPTDVVVNGTRHLHCVSDRGVRQTGTGDLSISIRSLDAALVVPGELHWMRWGGQQLPDMKQGWHWILHENAWNSASPSWLPFESTRPGGDMRYRFEMSVHSNDNE
jgi:hypothetical protein